MPEMSLHTTPEKELLTESYLLSPDVNIAKTGDSERLTPQERLGMVNNEFHNLIRKLEPGIKDGRWSVILVEGVSALPVGSVIGSVMQRWAEKQSYSRPAVIPVVVTGGIERLDHDNSAEVIDYLAAKSDQYGDGRTLVLTEYIYRGNAVRELEGLLMASGIDNYDVATLVGPESDIVNETSGYYSGGFRYFGNCPVHADPDMQPRLRHAIGYEKDGLDPEPKYVGTDDAEQIMFKEALQRLADELYHDLEEQ